MTAFGGGHAERYLVCWRWPPSYLAGRSHTLSGCGGTRTSIWTSTPGISPGLAVTARLKLRPGVMAVDKNYSSVSGIPLSLWVLRSFGPKWRSRHLTIRLSITSGNGCWVKPVLRRGSVSWRSMTPPIIFFGLVRVSPSALNTSFMVISLGGLSLRFNDA